MIYFVKLTIKIYHFFEGLERQKLPLWLSLKTNGKLFDHVTLYEANRHETYSLISFQ